MRGRAHALFAVLLAAPAADAQVGPGRPRPTRPAATIAPSTSSLGRRPDVEISARSPRWVIGLTGSLDGPVAIDPGGRALYVSDDGVLGQLWADGNLRWSFLVGPPAGPPALASGQIYVAAYDQRLYALDDDGHLRWMRRLAGRPVRGVAVAEGLVAVALETGELMTFAPDGTALGRLALGGPVSGSPVAVTAHLLVVPLSTGELVGCAPTRRTWRARIAPAALGPIAVASDGSLVVAAADGVVARVAPGGQVRWRRDVGGASQLSPAIGVDDHVYVAVRDRLVSLSGGGVVRWRARLPGRAVAGPLITDDGTVYVMTSAKGRGPGALVAVGSDGAISATRVLPAGPGRSLALHAGHLWVALDDLTLRRIAIGARELATSAWPKARGDRANSASAAAATMP